MDNVSLYPELGWTMYQLYPVSGLSMDLPREGFKSNHDIEIVSPPLNITYVLYSREHSGTILHPFSPQLLSPGHRYPLIKHWDQA